MRRRLREKLSTQLPPKNLAGIYNSFDVVGDIAIIKEANYDDVNLRAVAEQVMATHRGVKTVLAQVSPVAGNFRVRALKLVAGEGKTVTRYKEAGCVFEVDVEKCYFSPRLSYERSRIAGLVQNGETVVNMFAGVGCFSVVIAKSVPQTKVFSVDVNPLAVEYMEKNARINRVYGKVIPILGDAKDAVNDQLRQVADRVLMPLPEKAIDYLPYAVSALKPSGGWIHLYDHQHATREENPREKTVENVSAKLDSLGVQHSVAFSRVVRSVGPNWWQTVVDVSVKQAQG